jgi:glucose/arabinose dehydrogenase
MGCAAADRADARRYAPAMHRPRMSLIVCSSIASIVAVVLFVGTGATSASGSGSVTTTTTTTTTTSVPPNLASLRVKAVPFATGLDNPIAVAWRRGDNRMYVAQQTGKIVIVANGQVVSTALDLTSATSHGNEQGILGFTFTHDGTKMYVDYTDLKGNTHVVEWTMQGDHADVATRRQLLVQLQPAANHNGGQVTIGPDNMLYVAFGDGGGTGGPTGNGQRMSTFLGKILRIDPRPSPTAPYTVPPDNPFVNRAGVKPEIWMSGLRNPWRFSFDRTTRDVWIGDVGQDLYEEVDYATAGTSGINWGWSKREGLHPYNGGAQPVGARNPILERPHTAGDCAVTGGYVYRATLVPGLTGGYVFGDFCTGELRAVAQANGKVTQSQDLGVNVAQLTSFGEGPLGTIYMISRSGTIYTLQVAR